MALIGACGQLPNLKIEIENDLSEAMETDEGEEGKEKVVAKEGETEEGEISAEEEVQDCVNGSSLAQRNSVLVDSQADVIQAKDSLPELVDEQAKIAEKRYENKAGGFVTGVDIFCEESKVKLEERAKRFGLESTDAKVTLDKLKELYENMGVPEEEYSSDKPSVIYRLEAIHMRGTEEMSTEDVFAYFKHYCPTSIEWINDCSCNVVWLEKTSAARAMMGLTKSIRGLKDRHAKDTSVVEEKEAAEVVVVPEVEDQDVLMDTEMDEEDTKTEKMSEDIKPKKTQLEAVETNQVVDLESVTIDSISVPIPPGPWRLGVEHPKSKALLLRFPTRADKKAIGAEKMSEYYKKYGNPNYGGIKGIISRTKKRQLNADRPIREVDSDKVNVYEKKNPWQGLAESWGNSDNQLHVEPSRQRPSRPVLKRVDPPPRHRPSTRERLSKSPDSDSSDTVQWTKKNKRPRMRMYADDEEKKVQERKKKRQQEKEHLEHDLRGRLGPKVVRASLVTRGRLEPPRPPVSTPAAVARGRVDSEDEAEEEDDDANWALEGEDYSDLRNSLSRREGTDLRSKLNQKRTQQKKRHQKAPLQIEIDNDEYYKVIDSDDD